MDINEQDKIASVFRKFCTCFDGSCTACLIWKSLKNIEDEKEKAKEDVWKELISKQKAARFE